MSHYKPTGNAATCREMMNHWLKLNQIVSAHPSPGANKEQLDEELVKTKSKVNITNQALRDRMGFAWKPGKDIRVFIRNLPDLNTFYAQPKETIEQFQADWHLLFVPINDVLNALEDNKTERC